ncbi:MAG: ABC transporter permease [Erysipelotrichales bacterium]
MLRLFKYQLLIILKEKSVIFWTFLFPIILCTLFNFAFSNLGKTDIFEPFKVSVVGAKNDPLVKIMNKVEFDNKKAFILSIDNNKKAEQLLEEKKVEGIIKLTNNNPVLVVNKHDNNQMILQEFLNTYIQHSNMIEKVIKDNPSIINSSWLKSIDLSKDNITNNSISDKSYDLVLVSFFSVIAMSCIYGSVVSALCLRNLRSNLSMIGARTNISPYPKFKLLLTNFLASYLITLTSLSTLILFMKFVININFGSLMYSTIIICILGSLLSTSMGYFITLSFKLNEKNTVGIILTFTMIGSFLAGMMAPSIPFSIKQALPIVTYLNPVALITDSFTISYYYGDFSMILPNLSIMLIMTIIFLVSAIILLRRDQYEYL